MNKIDLENIKKIIKFRKATPTFKNGGEFSVKELEKKSTVELEKLIFDFEQSIENNAGENVPS